MMQLKKSETDPFQEVVQITIGATKDNICPVGAILTYLVHKGSKDGLLFT